MKLSSKIYMADAGKKGRGVFASKNIRKGEVVEIAPFVEVPSKDYNKIQSTSLNFYWYEVVGKVCAIGLGFTSLYNHSKKSNAQFNIQRSNKTVKITAIKSIKKGEEILIHYGYEMPDFE